MIKAGAMVNARATKVLITRSPLQEVETYDLRDAKTDSVLVYPGNAVEFTGEAGSASATGFYFIGGEIVSGGQKDFFTRPHALSGRYCIRRSKRRSEKGNCTPEK